MWRHDQRGPGARIVRLALTLVLAAALTGCATATASAATLSVTNLHDGGPGSLRQAIADAASAATITFAVSGTITLTGGELVVARDLTISGPGAASLSISGNLASRVIRNSAHLAISGLTIRSGEVGPGSGAGILNSSGGVLTVTRSVITANRAQRGGGIFNSTGAQLEVADSTVSANSTRLVDAGADASGAGIYNAGPGGIATITGSTFYANNVHDDGSGLYNNARATVANSTFTLGQAGTAAVYNNSGSLHLNNVTITLNNGRKQATGLLAGGGTVTVANSIIAANSTSGNRSLPDCGGTLTSAGHNLVGNATDCGLSAGTGDKLGSDTAPINAMLGPLTTGGGPTLTHAPLAGSPAIDAGSPAAPGSGGSACEATDQRGAARPVLGGRSLACDIGAVEAGGIPQAVVPVPGSPRVQRFLTGIGTGIPVQLAWAGATVPGSASSTYLLQRKLDAGAFLTVATPGTARANVSLSSGHTYQFRVALVDGTGKVGRFVAGPAFKVAASQESSAAIHYSAGWARSSATASWGGHAKSTAASLASATFTFVGRNVAWVAPKDRLQGRARVYVDGRLVTTVNLNSATSRPRQIAFSRAWTTAGKHTLRIVGLATAGHPRVTVDALIVLR